VQRTRVQPPRAAGAPVVVQPAAGARRGASEPEVERRGQQAARQRRAQRHVGQQVRQRRAHDRQAAVRVEARGLGGEVKQLVARRHAVQERVEAQRGVAAGAKRGACVRARLHAHACGAGDGAQVRVAPTLRRAPPGVGQAAGEDDGAALHDVALEEAARRQRRRRHALHGVARARPPASVLVRERGRRRRRRPLARRVAPPPLCGGRHAARRSVRARAERAAFRRLASGGSAAALGAEWLAGAGERRPRVLLPHAESEHVVG
jgi:hypothetical protein